MILLIVSIGVLFFIGVIFVSTRLLPKMLRQQFTIDNKYFLQHISDYEIPHTLPFDERWLTCVSLIETADGGDSGGNGSAATADTTNEDGRSVVGGAGETIGGETAPTTTAANTDPATNDTNTSSNRNDGAQTENDSANNNNNKNNNINITCGDNSTKRPQVDNEIVVFDRTLDAYSNTDSLRKLCMIIMTCSHHLGNGHSKYHKNSILLNAVEFTVNQLLDKLDQESVKTPSIPWGKSATVFMETLPMTLVHYFITYYRLFNGYPPNGQNILTQVAKLTKVAPDITLAPLGKQNLILITYCHYFANICMSRVSRIDWILLDPRVQKILHLLFGEIVMYGEGVREDGSILLDSVPVYGQVIDLYTTLWFYKLVGSEVVPSIIPWCLKHILHPTIPKANATLISTCGSYNVNIKLHRYCQLPFLHNMKLSNIAVAMYPDYTMQMIGSVGKMPRIVVEQHNYNFAYVSNMGRRPLHNQKRNVDESSDIPVPDPIVPNDEAIYEPGVIILDAGHQALFRELAFDGAVTRKIKNIDESQSIVHIVDDAMFHLQYTYYFRVISRKRVVIFNTIQLTATFPQGIVVACLIPPSALSASGHVCLDNNRLLVATADQASPTPSSASSAATTATATNDQKLFQFEDNITQLHVANFNYTIKSSQTSMGTAIVVGMRDSPLSLVPAAATTDRHIIVVYSTTLRGQAVNEKPAFRVLHQCTNNRVTESFLIGCRVNDTTDWAIKLDIKFLPSVGNEVWCQEPKFTATKYELDGGGDNMPKNWSNFLDQ